MEQTKFTSEQRLELKSKNPKYRNYDSVVLQYCIELVDTKQKPSRTL